jgi:hypothetical protein
VSLDWWTESTGSARVPRESDEADVVSGQAWSDFAEAVRQAGDQILRDDVPGTPLDRATGYRHLMILMHIAIDQQLDRSDPWYPSLGQVSRTDLYKWGLDCPDAAYRGSAIKGDLTYRVWGNIGTVHYLSFQVNEGMRNHGNIRGDQLVTGPDGSFELWIGPDQHDGNWLRTPPEAGQLIVRQFFYDWDNEQAATLHIERVTGGDPPAGDDATFPHPARVARQLRGVGTFLNGMAKVWNDAEVEGQRTSRNAFQPATAKPETGGAEENINGWGHFALAPDEALIVEVRPADAHYWSLHVGNFWWESLDYATRQTSLNGRQVVLDDDGVLRAVIAHADPGVPNWLDTMGHLVGPMLFRWVISDSAPEPVCTVVPFADVRRHLPASTPAVTPAERAATIARRRAHVLRRFAC